MTNQNENVVVETVEGKVRGVIRDNSLAFLGIPYAEPPVGRLRFGPPIARKSWADIQDATKLGATPLVQDIPDTLIPEPAIPGEDVLNLNVFTPSLSPNDPLPVLFWIHGGGFQIGSQASPWYDGEPFTKDGVVVVTCSYRLGFEGFGWLPKTTNNRAVLDWLCALEWVQRNIARFGGDPSQVTIAGQSAGGTAVLTLLALPQAQHLFRSVWASSPVIPNMSAKSAMSVTKRLAKELGIEVSVDAFTSASSEAVFAAQSKSTAPKGFGFTKLRNQLSNSMGFGPFVDGTNIQVEILDAIRNGIGKEKALVIGSNMDELGRIEAISKGPLALISPRIFLSLLGLEKQKRNKYLEATSSHPLDSAQIVSRYATDQVFRSGVVSVATARSVAAPDSHMTWLYSFNWASLTKGFAIHCVDVPFLFDCLAAKGTDALLGDNQPQVLADEIHGCAATLVRTRTVSWQPWNPQDRYIQVFDYVGDMKNDASKRQTDRSNPYAGAEVLI